MKRSVSLKVMFLLIGSIIIQNNSVFTRQSQSDLNYDEGTTGFSARDVVRNNLPDKPVITWISPLQQNTVQKSSKATISAKIKTTSGISSVSVYLNDVMYGSPEMTISATEAGTFIATKTLPLEPGENSIYLTATNSEGTSTSEKRIINIQVVSRTPDPEKALPSIRWLVPTEKYSNLNVSSTNFRAMISSAASLKSVTLYLNGVSMGEVEAIPSQGDTLNYFIEETISFRQAENNIYVEAVNSVGSAISDKRFFTVPASSLSTVSAIKSLSKTPTITWIAPVSFTTTSKSNKANITATIKSSSGISSVSLYVNDILYGAPDMAISATEIGTFVASKSLSLEPGENNIYFIAQNNEGSTTSEKRFITIPLPGKDNENPVASVPASPAIIWSVPTEKNTTLKTASTNIQLTIKSNTELKSVVLFMNGIPQGECELKASATEKGQYMLDKTIAFRQVENSVYLEAENAVGITTSLSRSFICPPSSLLASQSSDQAQSKTDETVKPKEPIVTEAAPANKPSGTELVRTDQEASAQKVQDAPVNQSVNAAPGTLAITWTSPSGDRTTLTSFSATVKASIKSADGLKSVLLYLNGISKGEVEIKSLSEPGSYQIEKTVTFGPGENNIYFVATSSSGFSNKSDLRYFSNPSAVIPEITWSNPVSANSVVNVESFSISACIKSATELRSVRLFVNGNIQSEDNVFQTSSDESCNYQWKSSVVLRDGDNSIYLIATNVAGSITSDKRVVKYTQAPVEKRLALIFGNSEYRNKAPLKNPVNDANLIEGTLRELGFDIIKRLNAGKADMESAIREFNEKLPDYNVALFYYAGHGNQVEGKNYLIPTDAVLEKPGDCKYEAIDVKWVVEEFEKFQENINIVILDACRSNPFASWTRGSEAGFRAINFTSGTIVAFATAEGSTAADGKGSNGLYTEELVKQMAVPQPISSVFNNTRIQVRKLSNNLQVPIEMNQLNGDFYLKK